MKYSDPPGLVEKSSPIVREAYRIAAGAHRGQLRKDSERPYIEHPMNVAATLAEAGFDDEVLAAALLHDVVEDTEMSLEDVGQAFGGRVAGLVEALTEEEEIEPYSRRKAAHRRKVERAGREAVAIYGADKLSNIRGLRRLYASEGEASEARFNAPLDVRVALWGGDLEMLRRTAPDLPFLAELAQELEGLQSDRALAASVR
jgi:guanosine-3',5'-bis(diphosphate) 3'-pyrophosphohydrolase